MENKNILIIVGILVVGYLLFNQQIGKPREGIIINAYDKDGRLLDTIEMSRETCRQLLLKEVK